MKKIFFIAASVSVFFYGCQDENGWENGNEEQNKVLSVSEVSFAFPSENHISKHNFDIGDEIGLHFYSYDTQNWESQRLTYFNPKWILDTPIPLSNAGMSIYAFYPYEQGYSHPTSFLIEHVSQKDYLYSRMQSVSNSYPILSLHMMHALALIEFEFEFGFEASPNSDVGLLDFISIEGRGLYSKASLDLLEDKLEYFEGAHEPALIYGWQLDTPVVYSGKRVGIVVVPVEKVANEGDILFNIQLNTSQVSFPIAAGTQWESGKKYTYKVQVKERMLEIIHVQVQDWIDQGTQKISLPYNK